MELTFNERQALIDIMMESYVRSAKQVADKCFTDSAYHNERDRQALLAGCFKGRIRMLLEDIAIWSPRLFAELIARMEQKKAA